MPLGQQGGRLWDCSQALKFYGPYSSKGPTGEFELEEETQG